MNQPILDDVVVHQKPTLAWYVVSLIAFGMAVAACAVLMERPAFDPTGPSPYAPVLSALWAVGLLAWTLRVVRSHQSRFGLSAILMITTVLAIGFANVFVAMMIVCAAMTFDFGVATNASSRIRAIWRTIQIAAGITGFSHALRVMWHLNFG